MTDLVSIIMPIYNTKQYLRRAVDSVLQQTYSKFELILVDDGSTDGSSVLCDELSLQDKRIKVIHQKNQGLSGARNSGIRQSIGTLIGFVDSDDWIAQDMIETLCKNLFNRGADLSVCGFVKSQSPHDVLLNCDEEILLLDRDASYRAILNPSVFAGLTCNKLFYKTILVKNKLAFRTDCAMNEDLVFVAEYLRYCKNTVLTNRPLYFYFVRPGSETAATTYSFQPKLMKMIQCRKYLIDLYADMLPEKKDHVIYTYLKVNLHAKGKILKEKKEKQEDYEGYLTAININIKCYFHKMLKSKQIRVSQKVNLLVSAAFPSVVGQIKFQSTQRKNK